MSTHTTTRSRSIWEPAIVRTAIWDSFRKLHPRTMARNPVMFVVEVGCVLTTWRLVQDAITGSGSIGFELQITAWLWLTVLFANFAEAMAEGRGKAQAEALRRTRRETTARRLVGGEPGGREEEVPSSVLKRGDLVVVTPGMVIPGDGDVIEGIASVDESAVTGESAPVIRESGGDRSAVTGGTQVLSDQIKAVSYTHLTLPISTTNMTGFLTICRGSSLGNDWSAACLMSCAFQALTPRRRVCAISFIG